MPGKQLSAKTFLCALACAWSSMPALAGPTPEEISQRAVSAIEQRRKVIGEFPWQNFSRTSELLEKKEYRRYEALLRQYLTEWKDAPEKEYSQHLLFDSIDAKDANLLHPLNEWITLNPSAIAFLVRGVYLNKRGQWLRGSAPTSATPTLNLNLLAAAHVRASTDLQQAIKLDPSLLPAYSHLLEVAKYSPGLKIDAEKILASAVLHYPHSVETRKRYLDVLSPAWGGSFEAMERFTQALDPIAEANPLLWTLKGQVHYEKAASLPMSATKQKVAELTAALRYANYKKYYESRAAAYLVLGQFGEAIPDLEQCVLAENVSVKGDGDLQTFCRGTLETTKAMFAERNSMRGAKQ